MLRKSMFYSLTAIIAVLSFEDSQSSLVDKLPTFHCNYKHTLFSRKVNTLPRQYITHPHHWDKQKKAYVPSDTILTEEQYNNLYDSSKNISLSDEYAVDWLIDISDNREDAFVRFLSELCANIRENINDIGVAALLRLISKNTVPYYIENNSYICERALLVLVHKLGLGCYTFSSVMKTLKEHQDVYKSKDVFQESMTAQEIANPDYQYILNYDGHNNELVNKPYEKDFYNQNGESQKLLLHQLHNRPFLAKMMWDCNLSYSDLFEILVHDIFVAKNRANIPLADILTKVIREVLNSESILYTDGISNKIRYDKFLQLLNMTDSNYHSLCSYNDLISKIYKKNSPDQEGLFETEIKKFDLKNARSESKVISLGDQQKIITKNDEEFPVFGVSLANAMLAYYVQQKASSGLRDLILDVYKGKEDLPWNDSGISEGREKIKEFVENLPHTFGVNTFGFPKIVNGEIQINDSLKKEEKNTFRSFVSLYGPVVYMWGKPIVEFPDVDVVYLMIKLNKHKEEERRKVEPTFPILQSRNGFTLKEDDIYYDVNTIDNSVKK